MPQGKQCGIVVIMPDTGMVRLDLERLADDSYKHVWSDIRRLTRPRP